VPADSSHTRRSGMPMPPSVWARDSEMTVEDVLARFTALPATGPKRGPEIQTWNPDTIRHSRSFEGGPDGHSH